MMTYTFFFLACLCVLPLFECKCINKEEPTELRLKEHEVLYFTHIPKAGGRAVSYWLGATYGANMVFVESRPASIFSSVAQKMKKQMQVEKGGKEVPSSQIHRGEGKKYLRKDDLRNLNRDEVDAGDRKLMIVPKKPPIAKDEMARTDESFSGVRVAFSHDRPDVAREVLKAQDSELKINQMTFLRNVHSHRVSMVEKYVTSVLQQNMRKRGNKKTGKPTYKDWVYLDGVDVHWKKQTYAQPQLGRQNIGIQNLGMDGARSYQLKWVARGRSAEGAAQASECGGNDQLKTESCDDDNLLEQGKQALLEDYAFFGLLERFQDSMCLLHYQTHMSMPEVNSKKCEANFRSPCLRVNSCTPRYVCPADEAEDHVHQYESQAWRETEALINEVEGPEVAFLKWAETEFDRRLIS